MNVRSAMVAWTLVALLAASLQLNAQTTVGSRGGAGAGNVYSLYDEATLERGKSLFTAQCGFCHGANAKGGQGGPDLLRAVPVLDDENGNLIGPIVRNGRADGGMPKFNLSQEQVTAIAAFLHEGVRAAAQRATYQIGDILTGNSAAGKAYFRGAGRCNACHSETGDLKGIGAKYDPVALQSRFVMPRSGRGPYRAIESTTPVTVTVTFSGGKTFSGRLERIDDFHVALTDANGDYHSFTRKPDEPKVALHDPLQAHLDLLRKYTDADIHNLTAYLVTLK